MEKLGTVIMESLQSQKHILRKYMQEIKHRDLRLPLICAIDGLGVCVEQQIF